MSTIRVVRFWLGENGKVLILLVGLTGITIIGLSWISHQYAGPAAYEEAQVVRFGGAGDYDGDHLLVVVRIPDGSLQTLRANPQDIVLCHVGSRMRVVRHGAAYSVNGPSCTAGN